MTSAERIDFRVQPTADFDTETSWGKVEFTTDDIFVVEYDFRPLGERDGIHVSCPTEPPTWGAMTSDDFAKRFGYKNLRKLNRISDYTDMICPLTMAREKGPRICEHTCVWCPGELLTDQDTEVNMFDILEDMESSLKGIHEELKGIGR